MVGKLKHISLLGHLKLRYLGKRNSGLILYKGTSIDINPKSYINNHNKGSLEVNKKWSIKDPNSSLLFLGENATLLIEDSFAIYSGSKIYINSGASLKLGSGYINHNLSLSVFQSITIGKNVAISENVVIRDSDNHALVPSEKEKTQPITIGDHVWIGINVTILKGTVIGENSVVAAGSVVSGIFPANSLIGGIPARVLKEGINWK